MSFSEPSFIRELLPDNLALGYCEPLSQRARNLQTAIMSTEADQVANEAQEQQPDGAEPMQEVKEYREVAAENIDTLSEIDRQIPKMMKYFAIAISQLTNNPIAFEIDGLESTPGSVEARKEILRTYALFVGKSVELIREELVKQINALEKYKVIPKSHPKFTAVKRQGQAGKGNVAEVVDSEKEVKNGGYGEFDVGVLNARASSGQAGSEHVLDRMRGILEELNRRSGVADGEEMAVDG
jgi:hypothetical protein